MTTVDWKLPDMVSNAYAPLFNSKRRYIAYKGSRGSGKSEATATKVIYDIVTKHYVNWLVLRRYANTNRQSTFTLIQKVATRMGVAKLFQFNGSLPEITYKPTGQKILFRGADKPLSITSISVETGNLCRAWLEECYQFELEDTFDTIDESLRGKIADPDGFYQTILTFNPWNENHWLKRRFFDEETKESDSLAITTTYKDNPFLDEQYVQRLLGMKKNNPNRARVAVDGEWGVSEGLIFDGLFEQREFSMKDIATLPKVVGLDFGFKHDPTAAEFMAIDQNKRIVYVYDEFYQQGMLTQAIAQALAKHKAYGLPIIADSAEQRLIAELSNVYNVPNIKPAGKGKGSIMQGIQFMQSYHWVLHPRVTGLWEEMNTYSYAKDKLGNWLNTPEDKNNHGEDSARYGLSMFAFSQGGNYMDYQQRVQAVKNLGL